MRKTIIISSHSHVFMRNSTIIISKGHNSADISYPLDDVSCVILESQQIEITSGLLAAFAYRNISLVVCDTKTMPCGVLFPLEGNSLQCERLRKQMSATKPLEKRMWQQIIKHKIKNQALLLGRHNDSDYKYLQHLSDIVTSGDATNIESKAAQYYWKRIFKNIDGFKRERFGEPPNNLLNYGYGVVRTAIARYLIASGLMVTWGIHHHNKYNAFCLADDIMEPYRQYVDELVCEMTDYGREQIEIDNDVKNIFFNMLLKSVKINGRKTSLENAISITASSVQKCFEDRKVVLKYPKFEI